MRTLTTRGLLLPKFIFIVLNIAMVVSGIYLTNHYMDTFYPAGLKAQSGLCNISEFWGCDKATLSPLGSIAGVPTSVFGFLMGLIGLIGAMIGDTKVEKNLKTLFALNLVGCIFLLCYSIFFLNSLCPVCTIYYVLSTGAFFLLLKYSDLPFDFDIRIFSLIGLSILLPAVGMSFHIGSKEKQKESLTQSYIKQFEALKDYGDPTIESPFRIHSATESFDSAPIRISMFSDFQCPYCQLAAKQTEDIIKDFKNKVNIQYFFYPLDASCNSKMKGAGGHVYACQAAYLAACSKDKFSEIHDHIFANQGVIDSQKLKEWEKEFDLENCFDNQTAKDIVQQTLKAGEQFNLKSTPTIIINGKKLEGIVDYRYLKEILQSLID